MHYKLIGLKKPNLGDVVKYAYFIFFPLAILFMEIVLKIYCFNALFDKGLLYLFMFSVPTGLAAGLVSSLWSEKVNRAVALLLTLSITVVFGVQAVYYTVFKTFLTLYSLIGAGEALSGFASEALAGIWASIVPLILLFIPFVAFAVWGKRFTPVKRPGIRLIIGVLVAAAAIQLTGRAIVKGSNSGIMPDEYAYSEAFSPVLSVPRFGVLTTVRLDIANTLSYKGEAPPENSETPPGSDASPGGETPPVSETPPGGNGGGNGAEPPEVEDPDPGYNVLEIDFDSLIANEGNGDLSAMHAYFAAAEPTSKNKYTGMFEGHNLIWIVAEGFSSVALLESHTPTLCKLAREGFVFNNFYNPLWGVSTSDGEYVATTGLLPKSGVWSYYRSAANYMPFGFGNMFSRLGYSARAYHGHTYTYYRRHLSYPNMGYDYKGVGNGLDIKNQWPESDVEVVDVTTPEFINDERFLVYYLTISGHLNYNFGGNMMAYKHKDEVADLPYSEAARAYIATQMEFDQSVKLLIDRLEEAGVLDNTVIVISGDHYPYGLETHQMEELLGEEIEPDFELYRSTLMIWNPAMDTVPVDKYCSSLDIMPTLANLFGLEYDSRLVMGTDILSDSAPLVMFNNKSFITDLGRYNSKTNTFTPNDGAVAPDGYAADVFNKVKDKFKYSALILDKDYYGVLLKRGD